MNVTSFLKVIPQKNNNPEKSAILNYFVQGVNKCGDTGRMHNGNEYVSCDVAVIQGWQHQRGKGGAHLMLRQQIIETQLQQNKFVCVADSNLFLYANKSNKPHHYLRYSFNGVFPNTGIYCDDVIDPNRWNQIKSHHNITLEENKRKGKTIVLCLQRNGGWSMGDYDVQDWIIDTVKKLRKYTDRTIIVRPHPGDKKAVQYLNYRYNRIQNLPNVKLSEFGRPLEEDLHKCWAVVNHNSSSIVGPVIQGYHAFITDPVKSQCADVANTDLSKIESPEIFDREQWLRRISMFHWNFDELRDGTCWRHMRNYCQ